jgi:hypothetical protein
MKSFTLALVAAAFGMTGFAYAGESAGAGAAQAPTLMSDAQMANVVAGYEATLSETNTLLLPAVQAPRQTQAVGDVLSARPHEQLPAVQSARFVFD